jgi:hypothetical protein
LPLSYPLNYPVPFTLDKKEKFVYKHSKREAFII